MNKAKNFPFRWVLPGAQLFICLVLLWPWRGAYAVQFQAEGHVLWPTRIKQPVLYLRALASAQAEHPDTITLADLRFTVPPLLNMPAGFVGFARLHPAAMLPASWRALSWPIFGILFWWIAGRAVEALMAARSGHRSPPISWLEVALAVWITLLGAGFGIALMVSVDVRSGFIFPWRWAAVACDAWALLGSLTLIARVAQWRILRRGATRPT